MSEANSQATHRDSYVTAFINGKGGTLKTSLTCNVAGACAKAGFRTAIVDLDTQGNVGLNLGFAGEDNDDQGKAIVDALEHDEPLRVSVLEARPGLDVIPGGQYLARLGSMAAFDPTIYGRFQEKFHEAIAPYKLVFLDCPPGDQVHQTLAMSVADGIVVPVTHDGGDADGVRRVGALATSVQKYHGNPDLTYLGYVVCAHPRNATRMLALTQETLEPIAHLIPPFNTTIGESKSAAQQCRERGQLIHELAADTPDRAARYAALRERAEDPEAAERANLPQASIGVADDYLRFTDELLERMARLIRRAPAEAVS